MMRLDVALPALPGMWLTKVQENTKGRLYWRLVHRKGMASCCNSRLAVVQNVAEIFNSFYSKAYHLFPSIKQLSQGLGAFLMIQVPFTITNSFPLNPEILSRVPNLEYTYSAVYHEEENHY